MLENDEGISQRIINRDTFLENLTPNGKKIFSVLFKFADENGLFFNWGTSGFSLNMRLDEKGTPLALCFGYLPTCMYKQSINTRLGIITRKVADSNEIIELYKSWGNKTECFVTAGDNYKWSISEETSISQIESFTELLSNVIGAVKKRLGTTNKNDDTHYWTYAPSSYVSKWDEFYEERIIAIGWDYLGDLRQYKSKEEIKSKMMEREKRDTPLPYMNDSLAAWKFANEIKIGDVIYLVKGSGRKVVARGIVKSDYEYDENREEYPNIRHVEWTHSGEWALKGTGWKTLTDVTKYVDYTQKLEGMIWGEKDAYNEDAFLKDVFLDKKNFFKLIDLIKHKKNIILQGAPGVGKTFVAKRLAYAMMNEQDDSRIRVVQFHQSYGYEDFIMGYRPKENGFAPKEGTFYEFCKIADKNGDRDYFFIIDEINRGNISKILGELLFLIEKDYRGQEKKLKLPFKDDRGEDCYFFVPKNVHIIGMMNTADRSIAMMDYALRRRFAFFDMSPAFDSERFKEKLAESPTKVKLLVECVKGLNEEISQDETLGEGFQIGHSYFCPEGEIIDESKLDIVVEHEIIPLIKEYWFDDREKSKNWAGKLRSSIK